MPSLTTMFVACVLWVPCSRSQEPTEFIVPEQWEYSAPLISPEIREQEPSHAQKDPTILFHEGHWHVFMTVKLPNRSAIEHCSFTDWSQADQAERTLLEVSESDYFCAPQVFYFRPHKKWYLVYQASMPTGQKPRKMWVAYSTTTDLSDPGSWSKAKPMLDGGPDDPRQLGGLDYWIICDDAHAYLFLTSLNGKMWRMRTPLNDFPYGFNDWQLALSDKIFEASHTYRIQGSTQYVTLIEQKGRRFFKAFLADRLDGPWRPIADTREKPFAGLHNIRPAKHVSVWTDNVSHGELVRASNDETLAIDPNDLRFVFQGMLESEKRDLGDKYGKYPWRIGILTPHPKTKSDL